MSSSFSSLSNVDGNGRAEAVLGGPVGLPVLRVEAYSTPGGSSNTLADAVGMQGFYVGADGLPNYTLNLVLTGQATGNVEATVLVFRDSDPGTGPGFSTGASTMAFEIIPSDPDLQLVDEVNLTLPASGAPASATGAVDITGLAVGDLFYVWASLNASGIRGTYGDAYNTLSLSYTNDAGLSQTAPVPEPGSLLLAALGLGALWVRGLAGRRGAQKL